MPGRAAVDLVPKAFFGADNHGISDDTASDDDGDDDDDGAGSSEGERRDKFNADAVPAPSHGATHGAGGGGGPRSARRSRRDDSDDTDLSERDSMDVVLRKVPHYSFYYHPVFPSMRDANLVASIPSPLAMVLQYGRCAPVVPAPTAGPLAPAGGWAGPARRTSARTTAPTRTG